VAADDVADTEAAAAAVPVEGEPTKQLQQLVHC
jgi:hypothetical protein